MKILTAQQMRDIDRLTVEKAGIPYATLMETAGSRVVEAILERYGPVAGKTFLVICGKGNNGGDGAVIARLLWMRGAQVNVCLYSKLEDSKGDPRANFEAVKELTNAGRGPDGREIFFSDESKSYGPSGKTEASFPYPNAPDFIVDALFGTGLSRPAQGAFEQVIEQINRIRSAPNSRTRVIAADIPSGLPSDGSHPIGPHIKADLTVTFTAPKLGNVLPPNCYANGDLIVATIGTPGWLLEKECDSNIFLVEEKQTTDWLTASRRAPDAHKGSVGDVLLIAGSRGKTGAAALAAEATLRAGAGLVTVATSASAQALLVNQARTEVMTESLPESVMGSISPEALQPALQLAHDRSVVAIGPGLSSAEEGACHFVSEFIRQRTTPIVLDADGLNALAPWPESLQGSDELPIIITPHPGEMARLTNKTNAQVVADRVGIARDLAMKQHLIVVLKGSRSIIAAPDGSVFVNPTGNAGMATAGAGDVLTGILSGLLAQQLQPALGAVITSVYLHGLAGDIAASNLGQRSLIASDITNYLHEAILKFEQR
ncbi:MAG: NAD(P)H-hydrate dehydratase [Acidobacteria bacterium]|nr:NAD(P)H-hydrate dehydratase [Acidobacteriota bacterium]